MDTGACCACLFPSLHRYSLCLPTEGWPGWVDLGGCIQHIINPIMSVGRMIGLVRNGHLRKLAKIYPSLLFIFVLARHTADVHNDNRSGICVIRFFIRPSNYTTTHDTKRLSITVDRLRLLPSSVIVRVKNSSSVQSCQFWSLLIMHCEQWTSTYTEPPSSPPCLQSA